MAELARNHVTHPIFRDGGNSPQWLSPSGVALFTRTPNGKAGIQIRSAAASTGKAPTYAAHTPLTGLEPGETVAVLLRVNTTQAARVHAELLRAQTWEMGTPNTSAGAVMTSAGGDVNSDLAYTLTVPTGSKPLWLRVANMHSETGWTHNDALIGARVSRSLADGLGIFDGTTASTETLLYAWDGEPAASQSTASEPAPEPEPEPTPDPESEPDPAPRPLGLAATVAAFLGEADSPETVALAGEHVPIITAMAQAYTRDNGFTNGQPNEAIAAVITTATARLMANPDQVNSRVGTVSVQGAFTGWSLAETFVLNRYRRTAQ